MPTTLAPPLAAESTRPHRLGCPARLRAVAHLPALEPGRYLAVHADGEVVVVPLTGAVTRLGRGAGCDLRFDDATISRRHAMVVDRDGVAVLLDDRSMNGTWLNGARVRAAELRHGDAIALGDVRVDFLQIEGAAR